jgi:hypothetical protein
MWSKEIEKRKKANGFKRKRLERFDTLKTSSLSLLVKVGI